MGSSKTQWTLNWSFAWSPEATRRGITTVKDHLISIMAFLVQEHLEKGKDCYVTLKTINRVIIILGVKDIYVATSPCRTDPKQ